MKIFSAFLSAVLISAAVNAQNVKYFNTNVNAIKGYDPDACFYSIKQFWEAIVVVMIGMAVDGNLHRKLTRIVLNWHQETMRRSMVVTVRMAAVKITWPPQILMNLQ